MSKFFCTCPTQSCERGSSLLVNHCAYDIVRRFVWLKAANYCTAYAGAAVRPSALLPAPIDFLNQCEPAAFIFSAGNVVCRYFCQWLNPSPCSWASVQAFYRSLVHTATGAIATQPALPQLLQLLPLLSCWRQMPTKWLQWRKHLQAPRPVSMCSGRSSTSL